LNVLFPTALLMCIFLSLAQNLNAAEQRLIAAADRERADIVAKYKLVGMLYLLQLCSLVKFLILGMVLKYDIHKLFFGFVLH
jgi:hypothetical protein